MRDPGFLPGCVLTPKTHVICSLRTLRRRRGHKTSENVYPGRGRREPNISHSPASAAGGGPPAEDTERSMASSARSGQSEDLPLALLFQPFSCLAIMTPDLSQGQQTVHLPPPPRRVRLLIIIVTAARPPAKLSTTFKKSSQHSYEVSIIAAFYS